MVPNYLQLNGNGSTGSGTLLQFPPSLALPFLLFVTLMLCTLVLHFHSLTFLKEKNNMFLVPMFLPKPEDRNDYVI